MFTPTISSPSSLCSSYSASSAGNDSTHGAHHVAQKSTRTTLPFRLWMSNSSPAGVVPVISIGCPGSSSLRAIASSISAAGSIRGSGLSRKYLANSFSAGDAHFGSP